MLGKHILLTHAVIYGECLKLYIYQCDDEYPLPVSLLAESVILAIDNEVAQCTICRFLNRSCTWTITSKLFYDSSKPGLQFLTMRSLC